MLLSNLSDNELISRWEANSHNGGRNAAAQTACVELMCRAFTQSSPDAFTFAHEHFGKTIIRQFRATSAFSMLRYLEGGDISDDVLHTTYAKLCRRWQNAADEFYAKILDRDNFEAYLRKSVYATIQDSLRAWDTRPHKTRTDEPQTSPTIIPFPDDHELIGESDHYEDPDAIAASAHIRAMLTQEEWTLLFLRHVHDMSPRQIVEELKLDKTPHHVSSILYNIMNKVRRDPILRELLGLEPPDAE